MRLYFTILMAALINAGCDDAGVDDISWPSGHQAVFVICAGNYGTQNASLSVLDTLEYDTTFVDVFRPVNGRKLGSAASHLLIKDSLGFICVTGSNRVEVIHVRSFKSVRTITGIQTPRQSAAYGQNLFITSYTDSLVYIASVLSGMKETTVKIPFRPNEIQIVDGKAFLSCGPMDNDTMIGIIDIAGGNAVRTLAVGQRPAALAADTTHHRLIVACTGIQRDSGCIVLVNTLTEKAEHRIGQFENIQPVKVSAFDSLVACIVSDNGPVRIYNLNTFAYIPVHSGSSYAAIGFEKGELFAAEGGDFVTSGRLIRFTANYSVKKTYKVGVAPAAIVFQ